MLQGARLDACPRGARREIASLPHVIKALCSHVVLRARLHNMLGLTLFRRAGQFNHIPSCRKNCACSHVLCTDYSPTIKASSLTPQVI